ncbi:MAG TPA: hypothetical protein PLS53_06170 [Thermoanaerobaculaceae bacterium]|nr:hypothetical protein [Thermoanaerobaculaceae bacterium]HPS77720.1 hypothetical protein [Thermoanaerobaculaceae bacterium]
MDLTRRSHRTHGRALVAMALFMAAGAALAMLLWNAVLPHLFAVPTVSYLQALGLIVLSRLLLGRGPRPWGAHAAAPCQARSETGASPTGPVTP